MSTTNAAIAKKTDSFSMTGFAQSRAEWEGWALRLTVKSVNHRFLDLKLRIPDGFDVYELRMRQIVREHVNRGHVEVQLNVEPNLATPSLVNKALVKAYLRAAEELRQETRAASDMDVVALLRLPGVIGGALLAVPQSDEQREALGLCLDRCLQEALSRLDEMRRSEGQHLVEEMRGRLASITQHADEIRGLVTTLRPAFARRLDARLRDLLSGVAIDPSRIAQEAAILAERSDISEELERLRSHVQQFSKLLDGAGEMGKKLDFLLQEMHREANTMLSKTPGVESEALSITGLALEIKSEIEKLREQVQNIE